MSDKTGIEWTNATWNPVRGCSRISEGCRGCYAERDAARFSASGLPYEGLAAFVTRPDGSKEARWTGEVRLIEKHLTDPLRWKRPRKIFVNSMSDLFHEKVPDEWIDRIFAVMALSPQHIFQVLTKRPERMREYLTAHTTDWETGHACGRIAEIIETMRRDDRPIGPLPHLEPGAPWWPLANVWLGVSCEDQATADERIPLLLDTPAAVRFISAEPLLGPIDLTRWTRIAWQCSYCRAFFAGAYKRVCPDCGRELGLTGSHAFNGRHTHRGSDIGSGLDWIIVGGESGPQARPFWIDWARSIIAQCKTAGVSCFVKQLGSNPRMAGDLVAPGLRAMPPLHLRDKKGGDWSEWPEDLRIREFPFPPDAGKERE